MNNPALQIVIMLKMEPNEIVFLDFVNLWNLQQRYHHRWMLSPMRTPTTQEIGNIHFETNRNPRKKSNTIGKATSVLRQLSLYST